MVKQKINWKKMVYSWSVKLCFIAVIAFAGWTVYKNPQIWEKFKTEEKTIIREVRLDTEAIENLTAKYEKIEAQNLNTINSKADTATVLGIVTRMDYLEEKVNKIANVSDQGALILTAVMLIKDRVETGNEFVYEAEILNQLAQDADAKIKENVETIVNLSTEGIATTSELIKDFEKIYNKQNITEDTGLSWKERIIAKFNQLVQIKKTNQALVEADLKINDARDYVLAGKISKAINIIEQNNLDFDKNWLLEAKSKTSFDKAVSKISAYSLAVMKVNSLRGEN